MIQFNKLPGQRILELGCGANRHPASDVACDVRPAPHVNFCVDMEKPFTGEQNIASDEFDCVLSVFALEHVTYRKVPQCLSEIFRVIKPGGKAVIVTSNTKKQIEWAAKNPEGWDGRNFFDSISGILFGDCDYPENSHKAYFSPEILGDLFQKAGFKDVLIAPYGARSTDLVVEATKPEKTAEAEKQGGTDERALVTEQSHSPSPPANLLYSREEMFDKHYFHGGKKVGGYAREGYWDFPHNWIKLGHVLKRNPQSVLELGCARGYLVKKIQDAGVRAVGMEISKHCILTRACEGIVRWDLCEPKRWPFQDQEFDLVISCAFMEHVPEQYLPHMLNEMKRVSKRCLHGIDLGAKDDGFDRTHVTLRDKSWWESQFSSLKDYRYEIVDKETLEKGDFPQDVLNGDGKLKVNVGSCTIMARHGWENIDVLDLGPYADSYRFKFRKHDVRDGLPYGTGVVDAVSACHVLEHFDYKEGLTFLKECRRVIRPDGVVRIVVPSAVTLNQMYCDPTFYKNLKLSDFDEINDQCEAAKTDAAKLWALLHEGHRACYDYETLEISAKEAGFEPHISTFRLTHVGSSHPMTLQVNRETTESFPDLSLFCSLYPKLA